MVRVFVAARTCTGSGAGKARVLRAKAKGSRLLDLIMIRNKCDSDKVSGNGPSHGV